VATGDVTFTYDSQTGELTITFVNTSPVTPGLNTPVAGDIWINLPMFIAATQATLLSQSGSGGAAPDYSASVDPNPWDTTLVNDSGAFGGFALRLTPAAGGGIASATGEGTPASATIGPVTFVVQLQGPQVDAVTAEYPKRLFSRLIAGAGALSAANGAVSFFGAGSGSGEGGVGDGSPGCNPIMFWSGDMKIGHTQTLFLQAAMNCHGCQVWSQVLGASNLPASLGFQLDMGGPTNAIGVFFPFLFLSNGFTMMPFTIPNDPGLVGATLYWHFVTNPVAGIATAFEVSPMITTTILP
jgi:hypothetical protein